ncbi:hypothetical protein Tco_0545946 [Tanacetum coccineum]
MPPMMTTRSASWPAAASRGGGRGGRAGSGGGRTRGHSSNQGDGRIDGQGSQVGGQGSGQGRGQGNGRNQNSDAVNDNIRGDVSRGCTYNEFLACNPKEYDGKGGAIMYTRWIEKMESVHDMSGCRDSQRVKYTTGSFVSKALTWWNSKIRTRGREVAVGMSWEAFKTLTMEEFFPSNEMQKLVPYLVAPEGKKIERNGSIKKNPEKRGNMGEPSKDKNGREDNKRTRTGNAFATTVNLVRGGYTSTAPKLRGQVMAVNGGQGRGNQGNQARGRGTHIRSRGSSPGPEHHDSESLDVIIGMDWMSDHKAEIICHEKVVRITQLDGKVLRVLGEKPEEKMRQLMSTKAKEKKQEDIVVVRDFPEVFLDDLSGLLPVREIKFRIELVPGAMSVAKSPLIVWHLLNWRSCRDNSRDSRTKVSFHQARRLGEHQYFSLRKRMDPLGCVLTIKN